MDTITGITGNGFSFSINADAMNDWDLLKDLSEIDTGNTSKLVSVITRMLGEEQLERLEDYLRNPETGRIYMTDMLSAFQEIMTASNEAKNS